ncbi:hypothetical protein MSG28_003489 [Choristoneura fumiferana]|uniref:Uncharacterized protein n=1 Tax=Choristoneura fumiferana TaxID=7141 RepID=A0ACC0KG41_CHOFU|nr:hypothetical protein MSG28_003489 [Choristoneura fumiferana]
MSSPSSRSPSYRNIVLKHKHSPIELKEKMRKNYKDKVQNCRHMLLNKFRGTIGETDLRATLTEIYESMFDFTSDLTTTDEEIEIIAEIRNHLVQEELQWYLEEYDKSQTDNVDWSALEQDNVICPVCQRDNLKLNLDSLTCSQCKFVVQTKLSLDQIKKSLEICIEKHGETCANPAQFAIVPELNQLYLICHTCKDMQSVI